MLARRFRSGLAAAAVLSAAAFAASCEKVPLVAPTGSTITLNAGTHVLSANGSTTISATPVEAAGTAPHSGTHITFLTTLGTITPDRQHRAVGGDIGARVDRAVAIGPADTGPPRHTYQSA